jgi:secondary thiamine-phosphate synthase enzyme
MKRLGRQEYFGSRGTNQVLVAPNGLMDFSHGACKLVARLSVDLHGAAALECAMIEIRIRTSRRIEAVDITREVIRVAEGEEGELLHLFCTHTTCGLTINENADPSVMKDLMGAFDRLVPANYPYLHGEGNSDAHMKSSLVGFSLTIPIDRGKLLLGTWQGIYLMEFDGPRERKILLSLI